MVRPVAFAFTVVTIMVIGPNTQAEVKDTNTSTRAMTRIAKSVGASEYVGTLGLGLTAGAIYLFHPKPRFGTRGGIIFDEQVQDALKLGTEEQRDLVGLFSDVFQGALITAPLADIGALYLDQRVNALEAFKLVVIDAQSIALSMSMVLATKTFFGRLRPKVPACSADPDDLSCASPALRKSFISGHTTAAFTGASLLCAHRANSAIFDKHWAQNWVCPSALLLASGVGVLRMLSDDHYATDVIAGAGVGILSGYVLPRALYFAQNKWTQVDTTSSWPGSAKLHLQMMSFWNDSESRHTPGAELSIEQNYFLSADLQIRLLLKAGLQRDLDGIQDQRLALDAQLGFSLFDFGWTAHRNLRQVGRTEQTSFEQGPIFGVRLNTAQWGDYRLRIAWFPWSNVSNRFAIRLEATALRWLSLGLEMENSGFSADHVQNSFKLGLGARLPWML